MSDEGRYSKISRRIWNDAKFMALTAPPPSGRELYLRLLSGPELGCIPGLFQAHMEGLAKALGWSKGFGKGLEEGSAEAFAEVIAEGLVDGKSEPLARHDEATGLWFLPNAIYHNEPANPNVIRSWKDSWVELPECHLKDDAYEKLLEYCEKKGDSWAKAFSEVTGKPLRKGSRKTSTKDSTKGSRKTLAKQEQEQEQEQELDPDQKSDEIPTELAAVVPMKKTQVAPNGEPPSPPVTTKRPGNLEAALVIPVRERSIILGAEPHLSAWIRPQDWPEVIELAKRVSEAMGWQYVQFRKPSKTIMNLVEVLATFTPEQIDQAVRSAPQHPWLSQPGKGLGCFVPDLVVQLLEQNPRPRKAGAPQPNNSTPQSDDEFLKSQGAATEL